MNMIIRPIENLKKDFDPQKFRITPWSYNLRYKIAEDYPELLETAKNIAFMSDKICVVIFIDGEKSFALCEKQEESNTVKFLLFNATETEPTAKNSIHAISRRGEDGNLRYEKYLKFKKGVIS